MASPTTLASAPGHCCTKGFRHTGSPVGTTDIIAGVQTYVSKPKDSSSEKKKIVLFFSDIYSPLYLNNQLVQDYFARQGECSNCLEFALSADLFFTNDQGSLSLARITSLVILSRTMSMKKDSTD